MVLGTTHTSAPMSQTYSIKQTHKLSVSPFYRPFSRWTWVSRSLLKQRMMEVVVTTGDIGRAKLQSNHHHQQTNIHFFTGRMPFWSPDQQCQSIEVKISHPTDLFTPNSPGVFQLCIWPLLVTLGEGCHAFRRPSDAGTPLLNKHCVTYILSWGIR